MSNQKTSSMPKSWSDLNLDDGGRSLIEASAGTGKTWTIAVLYLRLLLEREIPLSPRQIVVTTFTDAAAQELKERLRSKLEWALLKAIPDKELDREPSPDEAWLRKRWDDEGTRIRDLARLRLALAEMDVAPISTLHSLCRRILVEYPFACGVTFELGDMVSGTTLLDEVAADLWRRFQQGEVSDELVELQRAIEPDLTLNQLKSNLKLCLAPGAVVDQGTSIELDALLPAEWAQRLNNLLERTELFRANSRQLPQAWRYLAKFICERTPFPDAAVIKQLLAADALDGVLKGGKGDSEVLAAAEFSTEIAPKLEEHRNYLQRRFWREATEFVRANIHSRLQTRNQLTFDELLSRVSDALAREAETESRPLADALFAAWPVALVDEFQDTDAQQYGILDAVYRDADKEKRGRLVMIGDPKQAIYRFRGGDIHAYQRAAETADPEGRLTLGTNHRSSRALVEAFNQFYDSGGVSLSVKEDHSIKYMNVLASSRQDETPLLVDGSPIEKPLQIHFNASVGTKSAQRKGSALAACANQIAAMLRSESHFIGKKRLEPSDIAVLLPTGGDIIELRDLLSSLGVPCVTTTRTSVFDTDIARELQLVLYAVAYPSDLRAVRAAVSTRLWGGSLSLLQRRADDVASWQDDVEQFHHKHAMWAKRGLQSVVNRLLARMAPRYLETLGGERALTDLRHLGELLQAQSEISAGKEELLAWFNSARSGTESDGGEAADAAQLRVESDGARVRLMTLHASKGLEFPIVFLPLMWSHVERKGAEIYVASDRKTGRRSIEFSSEAEERELEELQDERFRVLYVAMTRAVHACHVFALPWDRGSGNSSKKAEGTKRSAFDVMLEKAQFAFESGACSRIHWVDGWLSPELADSKPAESRVTQRKARNLPLQSTQPMEAKYSFTALVSGRSTSTVDEQDEGEDEPTPNTSVSVSEGPVSTLSAAGQTHLELDALAEVRGSTFGNAIHDIFELRTIGKPLLAQRSLVESTLAAEGVRHKDIDEADLVDLVTTRIQGALEAPLGLLQAPTKSLNDLPAESLRAEMEFYFPVERVSMAALRLACAKFEDADLVPNSDRVLSGLMNGKIDLTFELDGRFHVLDYKSNYLGNAQEHTLAQYEGENLLAAMNKAHYRFQALIYTIAVDRYLKQRLGRKYDRSLHLGECVYLFVRAAGLAPNVGIWRHRFPNDLLTAVDQALTGAGKNKEAA